MADFRVHDFDLDAIAGSGQAFTWRKVDDHDYLVSSGKRRCRARQTDDELTILSTGDSRGDSEPSPDATAFWRRYFALDQNYEAILDELAMPSEVVEASRGIRVLAQDWWDASVSFIISQNSNIVRIQRTVDELLDAGGGVMPEPGPLCVLLADDAFAEGLRLGYRRPYLVAFAERASSGWQPAKTLSDDIPLDEQRAELEESLGIGPKVADCICLFGLGYLDAVPRDTWIKRAERENDISWHPRYAGIQQQYVFNWMRKGTS